MAVDLRPDGPAPRHIRLDIQPLFFTRPDPLLPFLDGVSICGLQQYGQPSPDHAAYYGRSKAVPAARRRWPTNNTERNLTSDLPDGGGRLPDDHGNHRGRGCGSDQMMAKKDRPRFACPFFQHDRVVRRTVESCDAGGGFDRVFRVRYVICQIQFRCSWFRCTNNVNMGAANT